MRVKTHQYIAETSILIIEDITGLTFNHRLLKLGACAPDLALNRRIKLHNPILAGLEYDRILDKFGSGNRSMAFLSYMLGVFSHYVADAFCFAHNYYVTDLKKHVQYEVLFQELKDTVPLPISLLEDATRKSDTLKHTTVLEYIQNENNQYQRLVKNQEQWIDIMKVDLSFAITNCVTLMLQMVYEVQAQQALVAVA